MRTEIETLDEFDAVAASGSLRGHVLQSLDLTDRLGVLEQVEVRGALFLGCRLPLADAQALMARRAVVFPRLPNVPFDAYRSTLYTADALYADLRRGYAHTLDGRVYAWTLHAASHLLDGTLAQALHDRAIGDALDEAVPEAGVGVGIMGGHAVRRGSDLYRQAARLGHLLADTGRLVITGGGPGVMEAANLGAALPTGADVDAACAALGAVPDFHGSIDAWASRGLAVRETFGARRPTVGIPTWFYGHEPPNAFATLIAKYFDNALREDALLRLCGAGIVYVPGAAGTTQEIFQAVTRNYYALENDHLRPMVLVGRDYWTDVLPAWPLLVALAKGRLMEPHVHLVDSLDEVAEVLGATTNGGAP